MEIMKGERYACKVFVGFQSCRFCTILDALPSDKVEDSSSDTPVGLAVNYG